MTSCNMLVSSKFIQAPTMCRNKSSIWLMLPIPTPMQSSSLLPQRTRPTSLSSVNPTIPSQALLSPPSLLASMPRRDRTLTHRALLSRLSPNANQLGCPCFALGTTCVSDITALRRTRTLPSPRFSVTSLLKNEQSHLVSTTTQLTRHLILKFLPSLYNNKNGLSASDPNVSISPTPLIRIPCLHVPLLQTKSVKAGVEKNRQVSQHYRHWFIVTLSHVHTNKKLFLPSSCCSFISLWCINTVKDGQERQRGRRSEDEIK